MHTESLTYYKAKYGREYMMAYIRRTMATVITFLYSSLLINAWAEEPFAIISAKTESRVDFKVNLTDLDNTYHGNKLNLENVLAQIDSMVLDKRVKVKRITVVGTASPEGPYPNNVKLAEGRAKAFINILKDRYSFPDTIYVVATIPEDWEGMRAILTGNNHIPYADAVLSFLDNSKDVDRDAREQQLKQLDSGQPYSSMHDNVLPYLRRASVVVSYDKSSPHLQLSAPEIQAAKEINPVITYNPVAIIDTPSMTISEPSLSRHFFALKTNLLWDAAVCANIGFEIGLWPHWSLDIPVWYSPYDITSRWRIRLLATQPEVRYWLRDAGTGHYFGVHTSVIGFNVSFAGDYRYQDPNHAAFGLGIGYGFAFHLDKERRWSMEAQIGAGYLSYKWIKYHNTGRNGAEVSHGGGTYWGITRAGIALSYKFYRQRKERRWMKW